MLPTVFGVLISNSILQAPSRGYNLVVSRHGFGSISDLTPKRPAVSGEPSPCRLPEGLQVADGVVPGLFNVPSRGLVSAVRIVLIPTHAMEGGKHDQSSPKSFRRRTTTSFDRLSTQRRARSGHP